MQQIYKIWPSISPWKQNNITEIFLFSPLLLSVSDKMSIYFSKNLIRHCKFPIKHFFLSNNTNCSICISIVSKWTQSKILQLPFGNSSIQILRDRSWWWAFATSFPGHCTCKASWVPHFSQAMLFNGCDSVMKLLAQASVVNEANKIFPWQKTRFSYHSQYKLSHIYVCKGVKQLLSPATAGVNVNSIHKI